MIVHAARIDRRRRRAAHAGKHGRAQAVNIGPGAERRAACIQVGRSEARRVHRREHRGVGVQRLARGAEVEQQRRAVSTQVDVGRFEVEVQQLVGVHFAQAAADAMKHLAHEVFAQAIAFGGCARDVFLQRVPGLVGHDHVYSLMGAEEIEYAHHVRVHDARQGAAFFEKTLQADAKHRQVRLGHHGDQLPRLTQRQRAWQVLLDGYCIALAVIGKINNTEPAGRNFLYNAVSGNFESCGQRSVILCSHPIGFPC